MLELSEPQHPKNSMPFITLELAKPAQPLEAITALSNPPLCQVKAMLTGSL